MGDTTKIPYCHSTWNPWIGCAKVHVGCTNCYAETYGRRFGVKWGPNGTRRRTADSTWKKPLTWNRKAAASCEPWRVLVSLCDVFEDWQAKVLPHGLHQHLHHIRADFFRLVDATPHLTWLVATKRPENVQAMLHERFDNLWLGYSASDQATLDAGLPHLLECRDLAGKLWLSLEPLLGSITLPLGDEIEEAERWETGQAGRGIGYGGAGIDWVVIGGESGKQARPCKVEWIRSVIAQCRAANVPCYVKQLGSRSEERPPGFDPKFMKNVRWFRTHADPKGGNPSEWPEDLRVREFPADDQEPDA